MNRQIRYAGPCLLCQKKKESVKVVISVEMSSATDQVSGVWTIHLLFEEHDISNVISTFIY